MSGQVKDRIIEIIAEQAVLEPSDISLDQSLEDLPVSQQRRTISSGAGWV